MTASCFDGIETSAGTQSLVLRVQKQTALKYGIAIQLNRIMVQKSGTASLGERGMETRSG
jgi:hypothetical protein